MKTETIKRFYNWLGARLDSQAFYEQSGLDILARQGRFREAHAVFEFGCGTGRFAEQLFSEYLSSDCNYTAVDISARMAELTQQRLNRWQDRVSITVSDGSVNLVIDDNSVDRFISTYVIDLLTDEDASQLIQEAHRILQPTGLICLVSITNGISLTSKITMRLWRLVGKASPLLVGGCRPVDLCRYLSNGNWELVFQKILIQYSVAIQVVVAEKK